MWRFGCGVVLCGALIGGLATPSLAADGETGDAGAALVGGFSVGDGLEAMIEEREGSLRFQLPIGGLTASWDSRRVGSNRSGLGPGWGWAIGSVDTEGGIRVFPASGGVYEADASVTSGLRGYEVGDVKFEQREGVLPARGGVADARPYSFVLTELGGVTTYFSAAGDALASIDAAGDRKDWLWGDAAHRLTATVDAYGVRTDLVWSDDASSLVVRRATNIGTEPPAEWHVQLGASGVESVTDPLEQATTVTYTESGLVASITGISGSSTEVGWRSADDGIARVDEVTTVDPERGVLSSRTWEASAALPTGWPATPQPGGAGFETVLSDGASSVVSSYDALGLLTHRELSVSTASGSNVVQTTDFAYPDPNGTATEGRPGNWSRPTSTEITYLDATGGSRSVSESSRFDDFGRVVEHTAADGSVTSTEYDPALVGEFGVPIGLAVSETVQTPDGLMRERVNTLNDEHTAVTATELRESRAGGEATLVERTEYDVDDDGFVREERSYPQGADATPPVVTRWDEQIDLASGTVTRSETVAAGSPVEATTSQVTSIVHGAVIEEIDELGNRTIAELDAVGRPLSVTDPAGSTTTTTYGVEGGRSTVTTTTPDGVERTEVHDTLGRVVEVTDNIATAEGEPARPVQGHVRRSETREYAPAEVTVTDAWGSTSTATHDVFGRVVAAQGSTGAVEVTEYDDTAGTSRRGLTPTGDLADAQMVFERTHDVSGNQIGATDRRADTEEATVGTSTYDGLGRLAFSTDGSTETYVEYDALGRAIGNRIVTGRAADQTPAPNGALGETADATLEASVELDAFGRTTQKTLTAGDETRPGYASEFDELGRTVQETDPSGASTRYGYTVDGLLAWSETSAGQRTEVEYDPVTRLRLSTRVSSPSAPDLARVFGYESATQRLAWVADAADPEHTRIQYEYDAFGNVTTVTYPDDRQVRTRYDEHGRKSAVVDVVGNRTELSYSEAGLLASAVQTDPAGVELARASYAYDELGRVRALDRGNGLMTEYTFTAADEVETERTTASGELLDERTYSYDAAGNLTRRVDTTRNAIGAEPVTTATEYRYDGFSRLIGSTVRAGERADAQITRETGYELSLAGDIAAETVRTDPGGETEATTTRRFDYSARGELQTITTENADGVGVAVQTYDTSGNLQQAADGGSYVFDAANRPVRHLAADGTTTDTEYWADGSRKLQRSGGETTTFHWDGETLVNETVETGGLDGAGTSSYLIGAARHARTVQPETAEPFTSYYGADRHGNVTDLTDRDGVVTTRYAYTDYGTTTRIPVGSERAERGIARDPFRYAGEHTDRTGTQHLATRSYDDGTMRFLSIDSEAFENRFAFADLNPIMHVDPTGGASERDTTNWLVAVVGALAVLASIASAVYTAGLSLHGLTFMSVTAAVAEATAVSVATAGVIDSFHDFMDDDTANKLMIAEIALPVGLALAGFAAKQIHGVVKATRSFGRHPGSKNVDLFARENWTPFGFKHSSPAGAYTSKGQQKFTELRQLMTDFNSATDPKTRQTLYNRLDRSDLYKHLRKDHNLDDPQRDRVYKEFTRGANQPSGEYDALFEQTRREMQHHLNTTRLTGVPRLDRGKNAFLDTRNLGSAEGDVRRVPGGRYFKD